MGGDSHENGVISVKQSNTEVSREILEVILEKRIKIISEIAKRNLLLEMEN